MAVGFQRELKLVDCIVAGQYSRLAMAAEIVRSMAEMLLGTFQGMDGFADFGVTLKRRFRPEC